MNRITVAATLAVLIFSATGCSSSARLTADRTAGHVVVDGANGEWTSSYVAVAGDRVDVAARCDDDALYLSLITDDPDLLRQIALQGLIVWVDPVNADAVGIRHPLGMLGASAEAPDPTMRRGRDGGRGGPPDAGDMVARAVDLGEDVYEILRPGAKIGTRRRFGDDASAAAAVTVAGNRFSYELRLPLGGPEAGPAAVAAAPGDEIRLGIQTLAPERPTGGEGPGGMGGGKSGGGRGGGMAGGRGGGRGMGPPAGVGAMPQAIEEWVTVKLAD